MGSRLRVEALWEEYWDILDNWIGHIGRVQKWLKTHGYIARHTEGWKSRYSCNMCGVALQDGKEIHTHFSVQHEDILTMAVLGT